jgi:hypothetical protein
MPTPHKQVKIKKAKPNKEQMKNQRSVSVSGSNTLTRQDQNWYMLPEEKIAGAIQQVVQRIDDNNYDLRERFMRYARLYGNYESLGWVSLSGANRAEQTNNRPVFNIIQSCIDTVNSKVARDNPSPYFITSGADYFDKLKAEKMTQFVQGIFQESKLYEISNNKVFRDACVYGLGGLQFALNPVSNKIECEWVFIDEMKIDQYDAQKDRPLNMHRCKMIHKEKLLEMYPDKEEIINEIETTHPHYFKNRETVVDLVVITESWHLRVGDKPGRHTVTLLDDVLLDEEYDEDWFPFAFFNYYEKPVGMFGRGITEAILSGQVEINKILLFIQQCQELQASPIIIVDSASQISEDVILSNNIARMIPIRSGTMPPQFISPQACSPEVYQHLKDWMMWCYQEVGISQTSAGGTKQAGVNSAIAMRTMVDIESSRFIQVSKNWEQFYVDCAEICVQLGKRAYENDPEFHVSYIDKKSKILKDLPWKKINLPDDMFVIRCDTISGFPSSAAGRIQTITDFISNQFITKERGLELLGMDPDLDDEIKLQTSSLRLTEKCLCDMVEEGIYNHPEKYLNLKLSLSVSVATYNQLVIDKCPEERLQLVRQWVDELVTKLTGVDVAVQALQSVFQPTQPAPQQAQAGLQPANQGAPAQ